MEKLSENKDFAHGNSSLQEPALMRTSTVAQKTLKIRCPQCAKLYSVEASEVTCEAPQFQCLSCQNRFAFLYPPEDIFNIPCFSLDAENQPEPVLTAIQQEMIQPVFVAPQQRQCPKCAALSPAEAEECYSCHVIFARLEGLPSNPDLRAQPSLVRKWKELLEDFSNSERHDEFVNSCHLLDALPFANEKYTELNSAVAGDPTCQQMLKKIEALLSVSLVVEAQQAPQKVLSELTISEWLQLATEFYETNKKYFIYIPYALSAAMILWGALSIGHRNLVGLGVATICLSTGLILTIRGKLWE